MLRRGAMRRSDVEARGGCGCRAFFNCFFVFGRQGGATMTRVNCPICRKEFEAEQSPAMPFCCERCRLIDLGRWLDERYSVPVDNPEESESNEPAAPDDQ